MFFDLGPARLGHFGVPGADIHKAVHSEAVYIGELRRGSKRGPKKGSFGGHLGSKRAVLTPFLGSLFKGSQKRAQKKANWG